MKNVFFLAIVMMCCSCHSKNKFDDGPFFHHSLRLSFQDASGNDLVKGIGVDFTDYGPLHDLGRVLPELYTLDVVYDKNCEDVYNAHFSGCVDPNPLFPKLEMGIVDNKYYLFFRERSIKNVNCFALDRKITFKLSCPYIFSDDKELEIVTFWNTSNIESLSMTCYRIEFCDKEITEIPHVFNGLYEASIILDR